MKLTSFWAPYQCYRRGAAKMLPMSDEWIEIARSIYPTGVYQVEKSRPGIAHVRSRSTDPTTICGLQSKGLQMVMPEASQFWCGRCLSVLKKDLRLMSPRWRHADQY